MSDDAVSMVRAAVLASETSMRAEVSDAPLVINADAQPYPNPVLAVDAHRGSVNGGGSSSTSGSKRKPTADDPARQPPSGRVRRATLQSPTLQRTRPTVNRLDEEGRPGDRPKIASTDVSRTSRSTELRSSVGVDQTRPGSPTASEDVTFAMRSSTSTSATNQSAAKSKADLKIVPKIASTQPPTNRLR